MMCGKAVPLREQTFGDLRPAKAPVVGRLQALWESMRETVIKTFPRATGLPKTKVAYLRFVNEIYRHDAYHSLSIEGYSVTPALIERVRQGDWDQDHHDDDRKDRDALAARLLAGVPGRQEVGRRGDRSRRIPAPWSAQPKKTGIASCSSPALLPA